MDFFETIASDIYINKKKDIITNNTNVIKACYGSVIIVSENKEIHHWKLEVLDCGYLAIGIDDADCKWINKKINWNMTSINYGYGSELGAIWNGKAWITYAEKYIKGDIVEIIVNFATKPFTVSFKKNDKNQGIAYHDIHDKPYRLAVFFQSGHLFNNASVQLLSYNAIKPHKFQKTAVKCICNSDLKLMKTSKCYPSGNGILCNQCGIGKERDDVVYHCPAQKTIQHSDGFDLCISCVKAGNIDNDYEIRLNWKVNDKVELFSTCNNEWYTGEIVALENLFVKVKHIENGTMKITKVRKLNKSSIRPIKKQIVCNSIHTQSQVLNDKELKPKTMELLKEEKVIDQHEEEEKKESIGYEDIIEQCIALNIGTREEIIKAMDVAIDKHNMNEILDLITKKEESINFYLIEYMEKSKFINAVAGTEETISKHDKQQKVEKQIEEDDAKEMSQVYKKHIDVSFYYNDKKCELQIPVDCDYNGLKNEIKQKFGLLNSVNDINIFGNIYKSWKCVMCDSENESSMKCKLCEYPNNNIDIIQIHKMNDLLVLCNGVDVIDFHIKLKEIQYPDEGNEDHDIIHTNTPYI